MIAPRTRRGPRRDGREGVALILVLLIIVLLSIIVVEYGYESQVNASFAINQGSDFEAHLAAKSAVAKGMAALRADLLPNPELIDVSFDTTQIDSMQDPWALPAPMEPLNEATMRFSVSDEYGKINLNALFDTREGGQPQLREPLADALYAFFLMRDPEGDNPTDAILDWLDYDDDDEERPEGAESGFYEQAEIPYACKNGPMDSIEELLLIKGITPKLYFGDPKADPPQLPLSEYLTVHGDWRGRVNANTAQPEVLAAMAAGFSGNRESPDLDSAYAVYEQARFEAPFTDAASVSNALGVAEPQPTARERRERQRGQQAQQDPNQPPDGDPAQSLAAQMWRVTSNKFRIHGDGMQDGVMVRVTAYVYRTPLSPDAADLQDPTGQGAELPEEPFRILNWTVIR